VRAAGSKGPGRVREVDDPSELFGESESFCEPKFRGSNVLRDPKLLCDKGISKMGK